ncbi:MAG TPA: hypothetical protein VFL90_04540 [Methylomirabilota bacterium]|nr:hypothetical protein [Methylomirabilota bacterium]
MRLALALALIVVTVVVPFAAQAGQARAAFGVPGDRTPSPPRTPSVIVGGDPGIYGFDGHRHRHRDGVDVVVPSVVFVSPGRCWQSGYWTYQWVPQAYSYSTYVPGYWADGSWIAAHYEPGFYSGGYYQPLWVEGYWTGC